MAEFFKVAKVSEIPPGRKKLVEVDFVPVALFNVDGNSTPLRTSAPTTAVLSLKANWMARRLSALVTARVSA